ncbi:hypothetical protein NDU88_000801 [Pleurodeles waltl]|uniref:Uncharacterized protein n=1 Tax=Pleurodeles waltl TaxID=8319 RepID=A0AAV7R755_PLEWA|nr:hypothetical protein NDU88_000801 [Pleurodeles waltl]
MLRSGGRCLSEHRGFSGASGRALREAGGSQRLAVCATPPCRGIPGPRAASGGGPSICRRPGCQAPTRHGEER